MNLQDPTMRPSDLVTARSYSHVTRSTTLMISIWHPLKTISTA